MKKILAFIVLLLFLLLLWYTKKNYEACCGDNLSNSIEETTKTPIVEVKKDGPLVYEWNSGEALTNELWGAKKAEILSAMADGKTLRILGPYFGFALGGKYKTEFDGDTDSEKIEFGDGGMSRFDAGMSIGACAAVSIFELGFTYNHGLVDISGDGGHKIKNRAFYISVAYKFGKNK